MIGRTLNGIYRLYESVGAGSFASVFVGRDVRTNTVVAVKVLHREHVADPNIVERFKREAEVIERLRHPNIVRLLDHGRDEDTLYLVLEYVQGHTLAEVIQQRGSLSVAESVGVISQVLAALDAADQIGIVHRDIKPHNMMLTPDGVLKVMDFGIARQSAVGTLTQSGVYMGTLRYMAPEILRGERADIRADLYGLGITFYQSLAGRVPFDADSAWALISMHMTTPPPPLAEVRPELPGPLVAIVEKSLAKDVADRYQTPREMLDALQPYAAASTLPLMPEPEGLAPTLVKERSSADPTPARGTSATADAPSAPLAPPLAPTAVPLSAAPPVPPVLEPPAVPAPPPPIQPALTHPAPTSPGVTQPAQTFPTQPMVSAPTVERAAAAAPVVVPARRGPPWVLIGGGAALLLLVGLAALYFGIGPGRRGGARAAAAPTEAVASATAQPASSPTALLAIATVAPTAAAAAPTALVAQATLAATSTAADPCADGLTEAQQLSTTDTEAAIKRLEALPRTGGSCDQVKSRLAALYLGEGRALIGMDRANEAIVAFHAAVDDGGGVEAQQELALAMNYRRGRDMLVQQDIDGIAMLESVYKLRPDYAGGMAEQALFEAHLAVAKQFLDQKKLVLAGNHIKRALEIHPDDSEALKALAALQSAMKTGTQTAAEPPTPIPAPAVTPTEAPPTVIPTDAPTAAVPSPTAPSGLSDDEKKIALALEAIHRFNDAWIAARSTANPNLLIGAASGQELTDDMQAIEDLKAKDEYRVPHLVSFEVVEPRVVGPARVVVRTRESWYDEVHQLSTGTLTETRAVATYDETYTVDHVSGAWLVVDLNIAVAG